MPSITDNFSFINGDVIYGDREDRKRYKSAVATHYETAPHGQAALNECFDDVWITIDQYNNTTLLPYDTRPTVLATINSKGKGLKSPLPQSRATGYANAFFDQFEAANPDSSFTTERLRKLAAKEANAPKVIADPDKYKRDIISLYKIRSSCKFGVLNLAKALGRKATIHFVLDSLHGARMNEIVHKVAFRSTDMMRGGGESIPVTASELRAIYRAQKRLTTPVLFYRNLIEVNPPWVEDAALWQVYGSARYIKHRARVEESLPSDPIALDAVRSVMAQAAALATAHAYVEAVDALKGALAFGRAVATPLPEGDDDDL